MLALLLAFAVATVDAIVISLPINDDVSVALTPNGSANLKREGTVSRVRVEVERLQPASTLGPALHSYVVWVVSPEGVFESLGQLSVDGGKGRLDATTRFDQFGILITAEPHYMVDRPNTVIAFRNQNPRDAAIRRLSIEVQVGTYDYSKIKLAPQGAVSNLVSQARVALQIARNAEAERFAEPEFRVARVSLDTMEAMLNRAVPPDILLPSANEAIRRSQRAVVAAREKASLMALENARNEAEALNGEKLRLTAQIQQLNQEKTSANNQIRRLESDLTSANRRNQQLVLEQEQALGRVQNIEREIAQSKQQQEQLKTRLNVTLRDDFFNQAKTILSPTGREALIRICGIAEIVPGPIRIEGSVPESAIETVRQFLVSNGVSQDRIVTFR